MFCKSCPPGCGHPQGFAENRGRSQCRGRGSLACTRHAGAKLPRRVFRDALWASRRSPGSQTRAATLRSTFPTAGDSNNLRFRRRFGSCILAFPNARGIFMWRNCRRTKGTRRDALAVAPASDARQLQFRRQDSQGSIRWRSLCVCGSSARSTGIGAGGRSFQRYQRVSGALKIAISPTRFSALAAR